MAYYCYEGSRKQINSEIYYRSLPSNDLQMTFSPRAVNTRHIKMPIIDCRKPSKYMIEAKPKFEPKKMFNPSNQAPFSGYSADEESRLKNIFFPLQACAQSKFIPHSQSDMYKENVPTNYTWQPRHGALFYEKPFPPKNADPCNLGYKIFNNPTKYHVKDLK